MGKLLAYLNVAVKQQAFQNLSSFALRPGALAQLAKVLER